ncbi:MAG: 5'-nucleotidase C-terminal domain-containing protein [Candidatus Eisenbacteria bacterium]|nr:5'-nucleotidase C-terminal domain-containing protein [Candidatus Eisenbacteria bacterium]
MRPHRFALLLPLVLAVCGPARAETVRVTVLHTTDLHGALTAWDYLADRPAARGLAKIATMVQGVRAEGHPVLLLDDGDAIQGGPLVAIYAEDPGDRPEPMTAAMTRMGYDAMAVGNHEFSGGPAALARARAGAGFPWLAANVVRAGDGSPAFGTSLVKNLDGVKVGVVGVTTPAVPALEDSANWAGLRFEPPVEAARREAERLRTVERCDVVVLLAHTGLEKDPVSGAERRGDTPDENWGWRLASGVPGADVVILGHTHQVVPAATVGGTLVTQAGRWGEALGRVDLELTRAGAGAPWAVSSRRARVLAVADSIPADSALVAFARRYHDATNAALDEPLGSAAREVSSPHGRFGDGPAWELIQRAQLAATGADVSLAALPDPAARILPGLVTLRDAMRLYPYDNALGVVELTGGELKETLEQSARFLAAYTFEAGRPLAEPGMPAYNFDAAEGVSYEVDLTRAAGERIVNLMWKGRPLALDQKLAVAVNSYRMNGGGGFEAVRRAPRLQPATRAVRRVLADHLRRAGALDGSCDRNWGLIPDYAAAPERPLIDLAVRQGVAPKGEVLHLFPDEPARRGDLAYWLARAFGWREKRLSGAFADAPDSLEPWLDGLLRRRVLGSEASNDLIRPFTVASLANALDWCVAAARASDYALETAPDEAAFRRSLLTGTSLRPHAPARGGAAFPDTLTRAQVLGLVVNARFPTLRVLETTDFHGAILPNARERRSNRPIGGSAVLAAHVARLRAENPEGTLLVDGGDCWQGTMISNIQFGRPVVEQMNAMGYVAQAIGNHDFDWTVDTLRARIREMRFAALGANLVERKTDRMPRWARADTVVARRGVRVGVLGLCYRETPTVTLPANVAALRFADDSATAARAVPRLRRQGRAQVVVEVGHIPAESDSLRRAVGGDLPRLARGVKGVDAWFGGHSHNQVLDEIGGAPVVIAGALGQVVGVCDLVVDPVRARVVEHDAWLVTTYGDEIAPDSAMAGRVARWNAAVAPLAATPVGRNARPLTRNRGGESTLGDLVTDAMRAAVHADVALQNSGGLRADLPAGPVTRGAVYEVMPFDNTIVTMKLTGAELRRSFEEGLRFGRVTQQSGLRFSYDTGRPELQRLVQITRADGAPLEDAKLYVVAVNNFMAGGGDNYDTLARGRDRVETALTVRDALERFIAAKSAGGAALDLSPDGRIQRVGAGGREN